MTTNLLDVYLTEMNKNELNKLVKGNDLKKIIDVMAKSTDEEKEIILNSVDKEIKKKLNKMVKGGLI